MEIERTQPRLWPAVGQERGVVCVPLPPGATLVGSAQPEACGKPPAPHALGEPMKRTQPAPHLSAGA